MQTGTLETITNRQTWTMQSPLIDDTGEAVNLLDVDLEFYVCRKGCPDEVLLSAKYIDGVSDDGRIVLSLDNLSFQIKFSRDDTAKLCAGTFDVFFYATVDDDRVPVLVGSVPVLAGGPR